MSFFFKVLRLINVLVILFKQNHKCKFLHYSCFLHCVSMEFPSVSGKVRNWARRGVARENRAVELALDRPSIKSFSSRGNRKSAKDEEIPID